MSTPAERRALLFFAIVAALGLAVRGLREMRPGPAATAPGAGLAQQLAAVDSTVAARGTGGRGRARPPAPAPAAPRSAAPRSAAEAVGRSVRRPEPPALVDVDRAGPEELDRLPGIGPALAQRIVADRDARGPFGGVEALEEVRGIGPALVERLRPLVTFSGPRRRSLPPSGRRSAHP